MCPETRYWPRLSANQQNQLQQLTMHRHTSTRQHIQHLNNGYLTYHLGLEVTVASLHHRTPFLHLSRFCHCCTETATQSARSLPVPLWVLSRERHFPFQNVLRLKKEWENTKSTSIHWVSELLTGQLKGQRSNVAVQTICCVQIPIP